MEKTGYTLIQDWMLDLPFSLVETAVYAMIYGFSQDGESTFKGSLSYVARKCKSSKDTARRALRKLEELGYIERIVIPVNGVEFNTYKVINGDSTMQGGMAKCKEGGSKMQPNNIDNNKDINNISIKSRAFIQPTHSEVEAYCRERGNNVNVDSFMAYYESNGWMVGKNKMKDWRAAVRTWEQREQTSPRAQKTFQKQPKLSNRQRLDLMAQELLGGFDYGNIIEEQ